MDATKFKANYPAEWLGLLKISVAHHGDKSSVLDAKNWALMMQGEMAAGKSLEEAAHATSSKANATIVGILCYHWKWGEQLAAWFYKNRVAGHEEDPEPRTPLDSCCNVEPQS